MASGPEKKKYFKIETSHTAPVDAPYSAANVKKRRLQQEQAERSRKRRDAFKGHIKRAHISRAPMTGGRLMQQLGVHDPELPNKCWLTGLQDKGEVLVCSSPGTGPIQSMLVNGDDTQSGMAVVYAGMNIAHPSSPSIQTLRRKVLPSLLTIFQLPHLMASTTGSMAATFPPTKTASSTSAPTH